MALLYGILWGLKGMQGTQRVRSQREIPGFLLMWQVDAQAWKSTNP